MSDHDDRPTGRRSKVARVIDDYDLEGMGERLERSWLGEGEPERSLRALADHFNRSVLEARMRDAGMNPLDGEVDNMYRLLTDDDVSGGSRTEARRRLEQHGIDIEELEADFVSYQAIRTYLTAYRDAEYDGEQDSTRTDSVIQTIQRLQSRTRSVAERSLDQLRETDRISLGTFRLFIEISVLCEECDTQYELVDLLKRGGCDCESA